MHYHGRLDSKNGVGVNRLIKEGAILTISPNDIINEIQEFKCLKVGKKTNNIFIKREYRKVYNLLTDEPISLDEISYKTSNSIKCTLNILSLMELEDLVEEIIGVRIC